jgi:hypothetical protein
MKNKGVLYEKNEDRFLLMLRTVTSLQHTTVNTSDLGR